MRKRIGIDYEKQALLRIKETGLPLPVREFRFCKRRWRFDFAYPKKKIAVEVEGQIWARGRHTRGSGFIKDCEKYNEATMMGWRVLRYPPEMIYRIVDDIKRAWGSKDF